MVAPLEGRRSAAIFCDHAAVAEAAAELLVRHGLSEFGYIGSRHALAARSWDAERREAFCAMKTLLAMMDGREYEREATFGVRRVEQRMSTTDMHGSVNRAVRARKWLRDHCGEPSGLSQVAAPDDRRGTDFGDP